MVQFKELYQLFMAFKLLYKKVNLKDIIIKNELKHASNIIKSRRINYFLNKMDFNIPEFLLSRNNVKKWFLNYEFEGHTQRLKALHP